MADKAHMKTDRKLAEMEAHLSAIYSQAQKEVEKKALAYLDQFKRLDEQKQKQVADGKMTEDQYLQWRRNKIMYGKHWENLQKQLATEYANVNRTALAYVNGQLPEIYSVNFNESEKLIDSQAVKLGGGYSFELVDADTVKRLATKDETLLPYKHLNGEKDVRWNTQKVNSSILQGILQGDSIPNIAKRLQTVTDMNRASAIRNARTAITGAECRGRQDSYERAEENGIHIKREWIAAIDGRTRHTHRLLDGKLADVDKPFESELGDIMFPGDPSADPANVYNCRCTIAAKVIGFKKVQVEKTMEGEGTALNGDKYAMNPKDINGVTRGEAMSFEDADGKAGNPKYRKGTGTAQNCQNCVVANEARRRGYNVSAKSYTKNTTAEVLAKNPRVAWVDPKTGDVPDFVPWDYKRIYDKNSYRAFLDENVKDGERYTLQFNWVNASGGHIISAERDSRGALRLYDPQTGKIYDKDWSLDDLIGRMSYTDRSGRSAPPKLLRVDNLAFREDVTKDILEEGAKVWKQTDDLDDWIPF